MIYFTILLSLIVPYDILRNGFISIVALTLKSLDFTLFGLTEYFTSSNTRAQTRYSSAICCRNSERYEVPLQKPFGRT